MPYKKQKRKYDSERAMKHRQWVDEYKVEHGCCECGYNLHSEALEFDHIDPSTKTRTVASMMNCSLSVIKREIEKCEVRCANCHRIKSVLKRKEYFTSVR